MTLYAYPGQIFTGVVGRIYPKADPERRTFEVDVLMSGPLAEASRALAAGEALLPGVPALGRIANVRRDLALAHFGSRLFAAGMTGELDFIVQEKASAVIVPTQAVLHLQEATQVNEGEGRAAEAWVERDGVIHQTPVKVGLRSVERTEVIAGLRPGDNVVISPLLKPQDGQRVRPVSMDPKAAAALNRPKVSEFKGFAG